MALKTVSSEKISKKNSATSFSNIDHTTQPVIIVGMGPIGIEAARQISEKNPNAELIVFGDEPHKPYNRVKLSSVLSGELDIDAINNELPPSPKIILKEHTQITHINRELHFIVDSDGSRWHYSKLILAIGSRPRIPNIQGIHKKGVYTFRYLTEILKLSQDIKRHQHVIVLGGGLLGLEAANVMSQLTVHVTLIENQDRLLPNILDEMGSALLHEHLLSRNISVLIGSLLNAVVGKESVKGVVLNDGHILPCDVLILCVGIVPSIELAAASGLSVGKGILVNDQLLTNDPSIYAIGECAEHGGRVVGLVDPGIEQASVVASNLIGQPKKYVASHSAISLKKVGAKVFSVGEVNVDESRSEIIVLSYLSSDYKCYRKLVFKHYRLVGAIAVGEWDEVMRIKEAIDHRRWFMPWQARRFVHTGLLWDSESDRDMSKWNKSTVICNCRSIKLSELQLAIKAGYSTINELKAATGASSVCGACHTLLEQLLTQTISGNSDATSLNQKILMGCVLFCLVAVFMYLAIPGIHSTHSVNDIATRLSFLWSDATIKQITGFSLLSILLVSLGVSLRKRIRIFKFGQVAYWRLFHVVLACLLFLVLFFHTGFNLGHKINALLMFNFLLIALLGLVAGSVYLIEKSLDQLRLKQLKVFTSKLHLYIAWPLPVLLLFHILSVYYF